MISRALSSPENPHKEMYAILLRGSEDSNRKPKMIGSVGIPRVPVDGSAVEVGYGVNPNYWGMGIAPEALQLFTRFYWNIRGNSTLVARPATFVAPYPTSARVPNIIKRGKERI